MTEETWKDIEGYEGLYQVSDLGRVKSIERLTDCGKIYGVRKHRERILKQHIRKTAKYKIVILCKRCEPTTKDVHRIVALHFCMREKEDMEVDHIDRNPVNNRADNLRWVYRSHNVFNSATRSRAASQYNGVKKSRQKWRATIRVGQKIICIGTFAEEAAAAAAFNKYCDVNQIINRKRNIV